MVPSSGFEPLTPGLGNLCSIQLSYEGIMVLAEGLEPPTLRVETVCSIHCATQAFNLDEGSCDYPPHPTHPEME